MPSISGIGPDALKIAIAALCPDPARDGRERRREDRPRTVFTIGKVSTRGRSLPCMVRNLSGGGMRIQMSAPPAVGEQIMVEMRGLEPRFARIVWVSGKDAGLQFDQRCDPADVFVARQTRSGKIARQPRFTLRRAVELLVDDQPVVAHMENISVGGARLIVPEPLRDGMRGVLNLTLGSRQGVAGSICWSRDTHCGFRFVQPLSSLLLALALEEGSVL